MFNLFLLVLLQISIQQENDESHILEISQNNYCNDIQNFEFSDSLRQSIWDLIHSKQSINKQNIEKWINNTYQISSEEYFSIFSLESLPWLIIAIASLLLSLIYIVITFKPSQIIQWIKNHSEDEFLEKTKKYHKFGIISIVIINLIIIISSIIMIIYSNQANDGLNYSICYLSQSFDNLLNQNDNNFTGYNLLQQDFSTFQLHYTDFQQNVRTLFQTRQSQKLVKLQQDLISFNDQLKRYKSQSPLPVKTSSNGTNIIPFKESYFSRMKIFDFMLSNKQDEDYITYLEYYNLIKQEQNNLYISDQINQVNDYYDQIFERFSSIENASFPLRDSKLTILYTKVKSQFILINSNIEVYAKILLKFHSKLNENIKDYTNSIQGLVIVLIIFSFIQIFLWIGFMINKRLKIKKIIDCLWFFCNLLLIGLLMVNIFLHSNSQFSFDLCGYFDGVINDEQLFLSQNILLFQDSKDALQNCLFNDGNIYEQLNITSRINDIRTYKNSEIGLNEEIQQIHSTQVSFIMKLSNNSKTLISLVDGSIIDLEVDEKKEFQKVIDEFNSFSQLSDCIELANFICKDSTEPKKVGNMNETTMCWHPSYLITKYSANCAEQINTFQKIKLYYQSQAQGWITVQLKESQFVSKNSDLNIQLNQYITKFLDFNEEQSIVLSSMTSLLKSTNCTFIKKDLNQMLDGMCIAYSYSIYRVINLIIIVICCLFISILLNCLTSLKVSHLDTYEEYASTKVINLAGSSRLRGSLELNQIQNESPMHIYSTHQEFK